MSLKSVPESLPRLVLCSLHYFHLDYHYIHPLSGSICLPPVCTLYFSPSQHLLFSILCECAQLLSHVWLFETPWTVTHQAPLSLGLSRQEYLSGLPFPTPEDLPDPRTEPRSPALQVDSLPSEPVCISSNTPTSSLTHGVCIPLTFTNWIYNSWTIRFQDARHLRK